MTAVNNDTSSDYLKSLQTATSGKVGDSSTGASTLGKDSFLKLLVTQLQNQNPLDPQDNSQFVAQLAQFSSVESLQNLSTSVDAIGGMYQSSQALQASSLVGRSVIIDGTSTSVDTTKGMTGQAVLPSTSTLTSVKIKDSTGTVVRTLDLGEQKAGTTNFTWDGKNDAGETVPSGNFSFEATGSLDGKNTGLTTYLPATVNSVTMGTAGSPLTLNLANGTNIALTKVQQIGI
ncbi:flagellar hook assembly protein FlgD [Pseudomonas sp. RC10]|uniref:flagellar hook assembly protein FlgD n=1 Tax=Pseudomonas bambusae TaxID=3139142 RepID=UPI003139098D